VDQEQAELATNGNEIHAMPFASTVAFPEHEKPARNIDPAAE
jgi:hypothetical protein